MSSVAILSIGLGISTAIHALVTVLWIRDRLLIVKLTAALKGRGPCDECDGEGVVALGGGAQTYFGPCPKCHP